MYWRGEPAHIRRELILRAMPVGCPMLTRDIAGELDARCLNEEYFDTEFVYSDLLYLSRKGWLNHDSEGKGSRVIWTRLEEVK